MNQGMHSHRIDKAEFIIRNEVKDWFEKYINEACGSDIHFNYLSSTAHFSTYTNVEISGCESQISQAVELLKSISEILNYKMPWLKGNTYYVRHKKDKLQLIVKEKLKTINDTNYNVSYITNTYTITGFSFMVYNFRPDLDNAIKKEIDEIFKCVAELSPLFMTYPKMITPQNQLPIHTPTITLSVFHGEFLRYLSLEDILSLEIANKGRESCIDMDLDHDIQMFLRHKFTELYGKTKSDINLKDFRIASVLRYFIHKYNARSKQIAVSNILTANEIQTLSRIYKTVIYYHKIIHVDVKPTNDLETVDFCAIYHLDPNNNYYANYDPKFATENYSLNFNADYRLDHLKCSNEFTDFVLKSQNNCSPQKLNSILQYVTEYFRPYQCNSFMMLDEFDLSQVSVQIISSVLSMMQQGWLRFYKMNFSLKTFHAILEQSNQNRLDFRQCQIAIDSSGTFSNSSQLRAVWFTDMDVELNLLCTLKNVKWLKITNCRISCTSLAIPVNNDISDGIYIFHTNFDIPTLLKLLHSLQCIRRLTFVSCDLTACLNLVERIKFEVRNKIFFINMVFHIKMMFEIFENCEIQNRIFFRNCHLLYETDASYDISLKPVKIKLDQISFDALVLFTILETCNYESEVWISNSCILPLDENRNSSNKHIQLKYVRFYKCRLQTKTVLKILAQKSKRTDVVINSCCLLESTVAYPNILINLTKTAFCDMKLTPSDLFHILGMLKQKSLVKFHRCEITVAGRFTNINIEKNIKIQFSDMIIETQIAKSLLQTDSVIVFDNCCLMFMVDKLLDTVSHSSVIFRNTTFDLSALLKSLQNFTSESKLEFDHCQFEATSSLIPRVVIKPLSIKFKQTTFDLEQLATILVMVSHHTDVIISKCNIQPALVYSMMTIKVPNIYFEHSTLEIETILCILKNFTRQSRVHFVNSKILCSNPNELLNLNLNPNSVSFHNMNMEAHIFQTFVQTSIGGMAISFDNTKIIPARTNIPLKILHFVIKNVKYCPDLLHFVQQLHGQFIVEYHGQLTIAEILEICTKTPVRGKRLRLATQICTKSIYFELFAEYFRPIALNFALAREPEYDLPTHLIPDVSTISDDSQFDWNTFKIKFIPASDRSVKLGFWKNGREIDLFFELNNLFDDSETSLVDYF